MENIQTLNFIKHSPVPMASLDKDLRILANSGSFNRNYGITNGQSEGKSIQELIPDIPGKLVDALKKSLEEEKSEVNEGERFIREDGSSHWLKWNINPWSDADGDVGGVVLVLESLTSAQREIELLRMSQEVANVGGWEVDLVNNRIHWSKITKDIHEVPQDFEPDLETGINFYKEGKDREKITKLVNRGIETGKPWDVELRIITAKGNEKWVRAKGQPELVNGKCVRIYGTFQDIDTQKRVTEEHAIISDRLEIATQAAQVGIWDYDIVNNKLVWDDNMYRLYGIKKEDFTGVYEAWQAGVHPEDKERGGQEIEMAISGEKPFDTEFRVVWPNGEIRYIRALAETQRDKHGNAIKMVGTNWDITELKNAQLELARSEESFTGTFDQSAVGMALVGLNGRWKKVNDSLCKSIGYSRSELMKLTFQDITHPDDLNKDLDLLHEVIEDKRDSYQIEKRYYHKEGHLVHVILTVTAVKDIHGKLTHFISQIMDISSRIAAEKRLKTLVNVTKDQNDSLLNFAHIVSHNLRSHATNMSMLTTFLDGETDPSEQKNIIQMMKNASESLNETVQHLNEVVQVKTGALEKMTSVSLLSAVLAVEKNVNALLKANNTSCHIKIARSHFVNVVPAYLDSIILNLFTNAIKYRSPDRTPMITITSAKRNGRIIIRFGDNGQGIDLDRHRNKIFGMYKTFHSHKDSKGIGLFITKNQIEAMSGTISVESKVDVGTTFIITLNEGY
ncbi:PAS domain-containing protein [Zeaxanthinibacter sp. PT1]|uniref:PAS domain-containing sensor histidine kinase n=1 Tax=Zeaxanthinibacter TaxID=561554 RepID=UPI0023491C7F|nr:PAS domain-containing protein [Zeaxanthinibacter sp. PT1]MDC6351020.1 PAS domain-containing protein [Zeaxanthinibacter sp. PT1]